VWEENKLIYIVLGLGAIVIGLLIYNIKLNRKIQQFNNLNRQANNLRVLQDFLSTIGEYSSVDEKIQKINEILIEKYEIKYSTIVVFNGAEYQVKASNVDPSTGIHLVNYKMFQYLKIV